MKLNELIEGSGKSDFVLIHDSKDVKGEPLIIEFIKQSIKKGNQTELLCIEKNPLVLKNLTSATNFNCHFLSSSFSWSKNDKDSERNTDADPFKLLHQVENRSKSHSKTVIIIDSLSYLSLFYPEQCYREIHNLLNFHTTGSTKCQLIGLLHDDVIVGGKKMSLMFERLASTNIYVGHNNKQSQVTIRHRKSSGRILEVVCCVEFDRKDIKMNKLIATTLESTFHVYDLQTQHPKKGFAKLTEKAHKSTVWVARSLPQNREIFATTGGGGSLCIWKYNYPEKRERDFGEGEKVGVVGNVSLLNNSVLTSQPVSSFQWSPDKTGLAVCTSFDQTLRVVIVTKLNLY